MKNPERERERRKTNVQKPENKARVHLSSSTITFVSLSNTGIYMYQVPPLPPEEVNIFQNIPVRQKNNSQYEPTYHIKNGL